MNLNETSAAFQKTYSASCQISNKLVLSFLSFLAPGLSRKDWRKCRLDVRTSSLPLPFCSSSSTLWLVALPIVSVSWA